MSRLAPVLWHSGRVALRPDMQRMRRGLERVLSPATATGAIFEALDRWQHGVPADRDAVLALIRGPLTEVLRERVGVDRTAALVRSLEAELEGAGATDLDVDVEIEDEIEDIPETVQMTAVPHPVSVLIVGATDEFARRLVTALGEDRVKVETVRDEWQVRHAVFSGSPLVVVVDACAPPAVRPPELAELLAQVPEATLPILWGNETDYGKAMRAKGLGQRVVSLPRSEGIEPLFDLVLSRHQRISAVPPA